MNPNRTYVKKLTEIEYQNQIENKIQDWCLEYSGTKNNVLFQKLKEIPLNHEEIWCVLEILDNTCHNCWNDERGCQCNNDE